MLIEVGMTVMDKVPDYTLKRDAISLETPDGNKVPLPTVEEYRKGESDVQALQNRAKVQRDSINYFPPRRQPGVPHRLLRRPGRPAMAWDQVELSYRRACLGRLYFQMPGRDHRTASTGST